MSNRAKAISHDVSQLAEDARALMAATVDVAGEKVGEARERLSAALDRVKEICGDVRAKTDAAVHEHPYQAIVIGVGVGALLGYLMGRRCFRNCD